MTIRKDFVFRAIRTLALGLLFVPAQTSCSSQGEGGEARAEGTDTVVQAILGAAAAQDEAASLSPRLSAQEQEAQPLEISQMGYNKGDSEALIRVVEISDFGCGYCRRFHEETFPTLQEVYVDSGLIQWKFIPFVMGMFPNGLEASIAGECGGEQDRFFPMQSRLFRDQAGWKESGDPFPFFSQIAEEEGLDLTRFNGCIEAGWRENAVRNNIRLGRELGVRGTPTFLIDGIPVSGALPLDTFRDILDMALTQKGETPPERG